MRLPVLASFSVLFVVLAIPAPSIAQYMFLDVDGDGVSTPADALSPTGPTTVDVWLRTDRNRDGSPASCVTQDGELTISNYEFVLHASNGTLSWTGFVNRQPGMSMNLGEASSPADYHNGYGGGAALAPGAYRLASVTVTVATGTPSISIEPSTPLSGTYITSFASRCSGNDFDNTLKLGSDWFDTDGLRYGGVANRPPVLAQLADMTVPEGTVQDQDLAATDADANPVTFSLAAGPAYASVTTIDQGTGSARGRLRVAPGFRDAGTVAIQIEANDGLAGDRKTVTVTVTDVNGAPTMVALGDLTMREGEVVDRPLYATDPDGDPVTFGRTAGPEYVSALSFGGSPATGRLHVAPGFADAGLATATITASDGSATDEKSFQITVTDPYPVHNQMFCQPAGMMVTPGLVAEQIVHAASPEGEPMSFVRVSGPDFLTVATLSSSAAAATGRITVAPGPSEVGAFTAIVAATDGIATDNRSFVVTVGDARALPTPGARLFDATASTSEVGMTPQALAAGDLDGDGILDFVTANLIHSLSILRGRGDGTFERRDDFPFGAAPYSVAIADLNGDGHPDLAVVDSTLDVVSVIDGIGGCLFGHRRDYQTGVRPAHVKVGDWNADGRPDLAVTDEGDNTISILIGAGDGTFGRRAAYPIGRDPCYSDAGDLNGDGHPDLVTANEKSNNLSVLLGNGDGTFQEQSSWPAGNNPRSVKIGDWNGDGLADIAAANFWGSTISVLLGNGDGTFRPEVEFPTGIAPWSLAVGDFNHDGHPDLVTANVAESSVSVCLGDGTGSFALRHDYPSGWAARFVVVGDANGDEHPDILVANEVGNNVVALLGDGRGGFGVGSFYEFGSHPAGVAVGDWNGDGRKDLAGSNNGSGTISILLSRGDGTLAPGTDVVTSPQPNGIITGDWNSDGKADLAVTYSGGSSLVTTYFGGGDGSFALGAAYPGSVSFGLIERGDVNGDGRADFIVFDNVSGSLSVLLGSPGGSFQTPVAVNLPGHPGAVAVGDLNGDGKLDLAVAMTNPNEIEILIGDGSGGFVPGVPMPSPRFNLFPASVILADLDRDGALDLAFCEENQFTFEGGNSLKVAKGRGDGTFDPPAGMEINPLAGELISLDANGDGRTDLAVLHEGSGIALFLGLGNGQFAPKLDFGFGAHISGIAATDLNDDGRVDLAMPGFIDNRLVVLLNRGTFTPVDRAPVVSALQSFAARAGSRVQFAVTAADPDGDTIDGLTADTSSLPGGNDASFAVNAEHTAGTFVWNTQPADVGAFSVRFTASNARSASATTRLEVGPANRPPTADAGGPYAGTPGRPVMFDGRGSSDPDGDALAMTWEFGDGASGLGPEPAHTYAGEGVYTVTLHASDGYVSATDGAVATITAILSARAFTAPEIRAIRLFSGKPTACFQVEPVENSFDLWEIDASSVILRSTGTGSTAEIRAVAGKNAVIRDRDRNGVLELPICFGRDDLRLLFGTVAGKATLPVSLEGSLLSGARFRADFLVDVQGASHFPAVSVAPNPMNPATTLTVATSRRGRLRAALYDAAGRLVRLLVDLPEVPPGFHDLRFDGRAQGGAALASGIYFYRVESVEGSVEGRIVMVR